LQTIRDIFGLYVFGTGSAAESTGKLLERQDELLKMEKQLIEQSKKYPATQTSNAERLKEVRKEYIKNREEIEKYYKNLKAGQGERTNQKNIEDAEAKKLKQQEDVARQKEKELQLKRIADAEEKKFRSEQTELYDKAVKQQQKEIDLYGDNTEAAKVRYETEYGLLKDILPLQKQKLIANAKEKDDLKQAEIAAEQYADTLAQMYRDGEEHDKKMADYRKKKAEEDKKAAEKQAEAMRKPYIDAVESIQGKFSDFFVDVFNGGIDSFSKLAGSIKQIFFKMIAELIAANISKAIFGGLLAGGSGVSLAGSLFGAGGSSSVSGVSGSTVGAISSATGGGAAGGSFLGGLGSSGLSAISTLLSGLSSPTLATFGFQAAQSLGLSAGASSSVASALGFAPAGAIGSFGANLLGLGGGIGGTLGGIGGSLAGGSIGASLLTGLGSAGGPVGAIIGGFLGTALGGLFGGGDPHYGGSSDIYLNSGKTLQHGSSPQASAEVAQAIQKTLAEFATAVGGKIAGGTLSIEDLSNASDYGTTRFAGTSSLINLPRTSNGQGVPMQIRGDDPKAFAEQVINELIRGGRAVGGLDSTTASLISSLSSQGKGFQEIADAVAAQKAAAEQLRETAAGAADATTSLLKPLKEFEEQAKSAGLTMAEINTYIAGQLEILNVQVGSSLLSIRQQAYQLTGLAGLESLKSDLTVGSLSQLSAQDKLAESRIALDELSKLALAGDAGASELFPAVAQQTLGLGREVFASGSGYQDIFRSVNTTLNQIIEKQQEKFSAFDISDLGLTVSETSQDQIKVLKIGFEETKEALLDIKRELAKRSA
jgi:hypothetical protein